jgi:hypothetical protein
MPHHHDMRFIYLLTPSQGQFYHIREVPKKH